MGETRQTSHDTLSENAPSTPTERDNGTASGAREAPAEQLRNSGPPITDRQIAILLVALTAAIYLRTVAPDVLAGDAGQFHFTAWQLGLSHPTGYPTYHLVGHLWQNLLAYFGISPALALNAFSAIIGAISLGLLYRFMRHCFRRDPGLPTEADAGGGLGRSAAVFTALLFGWNLTYWSQNLIAEVYTLHVVFLLAIFGVALGLDRHRAAERHPAGTLAPGRLIVLAGVVGFALTHHGMTLLVIPALLLYLFTVYPGWLRQSWQTWLGIVLAGALPFLLYLYIPLRGGPEASPWLHQRLGAETLTLYAGDWNAFVEYITGQSISVGFNTPLQALNQLGFAFWLWQFHFAAAGLILIGLGLFTLFRNRNYAVLTLTGGYALTQQVFNLFYNIEDILVYYIPLYLVGAIWAGFGAYGLATAAWRVGQSAPPTRDASPADDVSSAPNQTSTVHDNAPLSSTDAPDTSNTSATEDPAPAASQTGFQWSNRLGWVVMALLFLLPITALLNNMGQVDQSQSTAARDQWEAIMTAAPPQDAILATNDRDEIVGLLYMQWVENRRRDLTGVFPLMAPDDRFRDIGATLHTALAAQGQPVYLIKEMPGLEIAFELEPATPPLIHVLGAHNEQPPFTEPRDWGPLQLEGYSWIWLDPVVGNETAAPENRDPEESVPGEAELEEAETVQVEIRLYWRVAESIVHNYTTTVQVFDGEGERIGQSDRPAGGVFYPTSLWKADEQIIESHRLMLEPGAEGHTNSISLLVGMYRPESMEQLVPPLEFPATLPPLTSQ